MMNKRIFLSGFLSILLIGCNELNESPCKEIETNSESATPVIIWDFFSYHPMAYKDSTYISYIDKIILNKKFSNIRPDHDLGFADCEEAEAAAEKDFNTDRPALFQYNGPGGNFPLKNEIYSQVLGIHIENTGCYVYGRTDCYNQRIWTLINDHFGYDMRQVLDVLELKHRFLAIDINQKEAIQVDEMPTIDKIDSIATLNADTIKCRKPNLLIGRFVAKVKKTGQAEILKYLYGSLDCECEMKMREYFESVRWKPAIIDGDSIDSIVAFQFLD